MVWWHSCSEFSPLPCCFVFSFSCCTEENRFFRLPEVRDAHPVPREGTCQGTPSSDAFKEKSPFEWSCGGLVSPPGSGGSFSAASLLLLSWTVVLIHSELAFSLAPGNAERKQFLKNQWNPVR